MTKNKITASKAAIMLLISIFIIFGGVMYVKAPTTITLIAAGVAAIIMSLIWGIKWDDIQSDIMDSLKSMFPAILILLSVGMLVGSWILAGTVPIMVYYGLKILTPSTLLVMSALICAAMSVMAGTSWGTIGTVGVALMGVSSGLGIPLHYTAGAITVGAIFGDKLSPLSDTTVMASAVSDVDIVDHIKHMLYTTLPGFIISLILYGILGMKFKEGTVSGENLNLILNTLENTFNLNPVLLLPPVVVLFLIYRKKPTLPVFGVGIIFGCLLAALFQGQNLQSIANALNGGYTTSTEVAIVDRMLIRGGLKSMLGTTALLIAAAIFGSPLRTSGVIGIMLSKVKEIAQKGRTILVSTFFLHGFFFIITGSYYVTFAVLGPMIRPLYNKYGLHRKNLSRTLEDTGTALAPIIPWSVTGAFIASTLEVPTVEYLPFAPMTYLGLVFSLIYMFTGFGIAKVDKDNNSGKVNA